MSLQRGINLRALAEKMGQCSGAEVRGICSEAGMFCVHSYFEAIDEHPDPGMYALRERRQHVTQEDFEFAVAKVRRLYRIHLMCIGGMNSANFCLPHTGAQEEPRGEYFRQQAILLNLVLVVLHI
jgi:ATP-dependent 26S proteasome regulatory subunit